ncbi:MAG: hypothetical protein AAFV95_15310 [Bacteroidota bacterium]
MKKKTELQASSIGGAMKTKLADFVTFRIGKEQGSKVKGGSADANAGAEYVHEDEIES